VAVSCEHGDQSSVFIKDGEFLDNLRDYQLFKKDSAAQS
jgi:hypothetical protein